MGKAQYLVDERGQKKYRRLNMKRKITLFLATLIWLLPISVHAGWDVSVSKPDEMTGKQSVFAMSPDTLPTKKMGFPCSDTEANLVVGCDKTSEWVYVYFTESPNLINVDIKDSYNLIRTRIKWDDKVEYVTLTQSWGAKFLSFRDDKSIITKIAKSDSVLLELNWFGEGKTYFKFSLSGSSAALKEMRDKCR